MKSILVVTDFSPAGQNAAYYGAALANAVGADLYLFNAYSELPVTYVETPVSVSGVELKELVRFNLERTAALIFEKERIQCTVSSEEGPATDLILDEITKRKADLIITGLKSEGKGLRKLFGSTVTALIGKIQIPMIVVPEEAEFAGVKSIALAIEHDMTPDANKELLKVLVEIGERFDSKLYLVHIARNSFQEAFSLLNRPVRLTRLMKTLDPQFECVRSTGVAGALNEFISAYGVNIMAMLPHHHSFPGMATSATRSMIFKSRIPVLVLPGIDTARLTDIRSSKEIIV